MRNNLNSRLGGEIDYANALLEIQNEAESITQIWANYKIDVKPYEIDYIEF